MEALTRYVGPMPVWAWMVLAAGALYLWHKHETSSGGTSSLSNLFGGSGTGSNSADAQTVSGLEAAQDDASTTTSNAAWGQDAIAYLEGQGYTASQAEAAIGTYTSGGTLDPSMATLVDNAVQNVGQPPQLILPTNPSTTGSSSVTSTTSSGAGTATGSPTSSYVTQNQSAYSALGASATNGGPVDTSGHRAYFQYTVKKGDTQAKIGQMFGSSAKQLEAWNPSLANGGKVKVGQKIWV